MQGILLTQNDVFILGPIAKILGFIMDIIFNVLDFIGIPNIGLSIILFTVIVYLFMLPLTIKQQKFSKLSAKMNPELEVIKEKYKGKDDQASLMRQQEETKAVYDKYGVSPTGSCVQLLIQMPILFALYRVIYAIPAYVGKIKDVYLPLVSKLMKEEGVHFYLNTAIETKKQAKDMLSKYDSIVLACGSRVPRDIVVEGRNAKNIMFAVDYLTDVTKSLLNSNFKDKEYFDVKDKNVLVIGGGDTGNDCVATAIRHGCKNVIQLEMMEELPTERQENNPWPEYPMIKKTDYGQQESIALFKKDPRIYQTTVSKFILNEKQEVIKAVIVSLERKNGKMEIIKGSEKEIDVDLVLIAAGFIGCETKITKAFGVELDERQTVKTDEDSHKTNVKKVYVAGDMRRGQSLVVWAIREGRDTAKEIDFDLMGYTTL